MPHRIVVSGIGVVSPLGVGRDAFWDGLVGGRVGVSRLAGLDAVPEAYRFGGRLGDFRPDEIIGSKGLKHLNDAARLLLCAAELARRDARLQIDPDLADDVGVVIASGFSNLGDCTGFYESLLSTEERPNPLRFPNLFINVAGGNLAIRFGIRGLNTTVTNGATSSLDALHHGIIALRCGRARALLVAGVEVLSTPLIEGLWRVGVLGDTMAPRPFDRRRRGMIPGEGCGVVVLEPAEAAQRRGARIYGEVLGYGTAPVEAGESAVACSEAIAAAMGSALTAAAVEVAEVDYLAAGASSSPSGDRGEAMAIRRLFGAGAPRLRTSAIKSMLGDALAASGMLQVIACLLAAEHHRVPPTMNCEDEDPNCQVSSHVRDRSQAHTVRTAIANSFDCDRAASLVVRRNADATRSTGAGQGRG
jgi:3-oxoacyl-[acyl-carrier-protein] synthase II